MQVFILCALVAVSYAAPRTCHGDINNLHPTGKASGGIQASVIAAIASRETRGGTLLVATGGWGDNHNAWGIMQCDVRYSGLPCTSVPWDSCEHIEMLVNRLLVPYVTQVHNKFPSWSLDQALQGAVAGYNGGVSRLASWSTVDAHTTGHDYSNDVIARAKYLMAHGWN
ncbi:glycine, glutamate and proline-rich protein-like isoform X2 [Biomphalaria glabrata]|uniref:Glycine, glutamate and proline-rich protein-like isoform X2 n=1 Tax=Biomphalaria glabrata TaxID=6526 RepID=A0A9W2YQM8_BIOGL|nr:glycine, glutamate and proline-rich protein-like isoform X2 [Biomphalaria glabrata]